MIMSWKAVLVTSAAALATAQAPPQPVFRAASDLVQVDVSVLDGKRLPVKGLTAADFTVLEDHVSRPIEAFAAIDLTDRPSTQSALWTRDVPPDVATNRVGDEDGRIVVILMDRSIPFGAPVTAARQIATAAVNALGPNDLAALISTSGGVPQNLTADRGRLLRAINQRDWSTDISDDAKAAEAAVGFDPDIFNSLTDGRCLCALCVLHTITNVASALEAMPRRQKSLLFIGASIIFQAAPQDQRVEMGCGQKLEDARNVMWTALDRSGVRVHSIDPSGLEVTPPPGTMAPPLRGGRPPDPFAEAVRAHLERQGSLFVLPERTGGRVVTSTNAPEAKVPDIMRESASYYLLGYRPSEPQVPGQTRTIDVKVNRRDVSVSARREYLVPAAANASMDTAQNTIGSAISSAIPAAGVELAMGASAFATGASSPGRMVLALDLSGIAERLEAAGDGTRRVTIAVAAFNAFGKLVNGIEKVVTLPTTVRAPDAPLEALLQLPLPPGDFELRAAVTANAAVRPSSVFANVTMPPFALLPFSLSNIFIAALPGTVTMMPDRITDPLPMIPTTRREFPHAASVTAVLRVYQGPALSSAMSPVTLTARIVDAQNVVRAQQTRAVTAAEFGSTRSVDAGFAFPLQPLEPGEYLLSIQGVVGPRVAGRAVRFTVLR